MLRIRSTMAMLGPVLLLTLAPLSADARARHAPPLPDANPKRVAAHTLPLTEDSLPHRNPRRTHLTPEARHMAHEVTSDDVTETLPGGTIRPARTAVVAGGPKPELVAMAITRPESSVPPASPAPSDTPQSSVPTEPLPALPVVPVEKSAEAPSSPAEKSEAAVKTDGPPLPERKADHVDDAEVAAVPLPARKPPIPEALRPKGYGYAKALQPLLDYALSGDDRTALKESIRLAYVGKVSDAEAWERKINDKAARKLAQWYILRTDDVHEPAHAIEQFRKANRDWPGQEDLRENAETTLFFGKASPGRIEDFFESSPPRTGVGLAALARAELTRGHKDKAKALVAKAWRTHLLNKKIEKAILDRFPGMLSDADHKRRIDWLLMKDSRARVEPALRTAELVGDGELKVVKARAAIVRRDRDADALFKKLSDDEKRELGMRYNRMQWLRRNDRDREAWPILLAAPTDLKFLADPDEWWIERRIHARSALNHGEPEIAYRIVSNHRAQSEEYYTEAEFLAGWIALRHLDRKGTAFRHFRKMWKASTHPRRKARAAYWLGRTRAAQGQTADAKRYFEEAAKYVRTYHGQLALQELSPGIGALPLPKEPDPTPADVAAFMNNDAVRAIAVAGKAGLTTLHWLFFTQLARSLDSTPQLALLSEYARALGEIQTSVRVAKMAVYRDHPVYAQAFPTSVLPGFVEVNTPVEPAFLHALARQESEFNADAHSPVGAKGLMQIMPATARMICRQHRLDYHPGKLTDDPAYNLQLGSAHLRDLIDSYRGSYIMTLAAYNAGGARVKEWVDAAGDPRDPKTDPIDWVEQIPFTETRRYVQKIMATIQIFRAKLQGRDKALQLTEDLYRGRPDSAAPAPSIDPRSVATNAGPAQPHAPQTPASH